MPKKSKLSYEEKLKAIAEYKQGLGSLESIGRKYNIHHESFRCMVLKYDSGLMSELQEKNTIKTYSSELKTQAVIDYLSGKGSLMDICIKYNISSKSILIKWIKWYNSHKEFKERSFGKDIYMTKARKTTQKERFEIVSFCIANGKNYGLTVEKYDVSYQQIYSWVKKYEEKGIDGLSDNRGKSKTTDEMNEIEKLRYENKLLQAKLKEKEMEIDVIKKLQEVERRYR